MPGTTIRRAVGFAAVAILVASCAASNDTGEAIPEPATTDIAESETTAETTTPPTSSSAATSSLPAVEPVRMNHIQVIGSHNSFHLVPQPVLFEGIVAVSAELGRDIEYSHRTLTEQLVEFGIRQFELDVFADPDGGLYANRAANAVVGLAVESGEPALNDPGFKVMHTQDFDYETTCFTLVACLSEIDAWSSDNRNHVPRDSACQRGTLPQH